MSFLDVPPRNPSQGPLSHGVVSGVLIQMQLASAHTVRILGRPTPLEAGVAQSLIQDRSTPQNTTQLYGLITSVLDQVGILTEGLHISINMRLMAKEKTLRKSVVKRAISRDEELFQQLVIGKIIARETLVSALNITNNTLTGYIATMRPKYFPHHIIVTADQGLLLLEDSDDFIQGTTGLFTEDEQRTPTRTTVFMYLIFKNIGANVPFRMSEVFKKMESIGLPVRKKENLIALVKQLFGNKGYLLRSDGKGNYTLSKISE
ncbi:hypothetical protein KBC86_05255 [Candidatus Gracilibacteria bacterium]|nr:hypothetical protein [Candidatus Gracilibacteria bacterium]